MAGRHTPPQSAPPQPAVHISATAGAPATANTAAGAARTPVVVMPRSRGDHVVNQQQLWPERAAHYGSSSAASTSSNAAASSSTTAAALAPNGLSVAIAAESPGDMSLASPSGTGGSGGGGSGGLVNRLNGRPASFAAAASTVVSPFAKSASSGSNSSAAAGMALPGSVGAASGNAGHISARTGAEIIVDMTMGGLGHGIVVGSDENVHARHKRPVMLLPPCCDGALGLKIPELIRGRVANVTLPSRLALLGRQSYETLAVLNPISLGNSVLGFAPVWGRQERHAPLVANQLVVLPWIFSTNGARISFFLRILALLVLLVFFFQFVQIYNLNIGRAWLFGSSVALFVMWKLALIRRAPDGIMAFCRSMGAPEIEEYMFSYSWKVEPDAIRTLAKAVWNNGVGVWIDVVKLCPGDEIRPMVRTMVNRVHRCVVFLSPAYIGSPNCCVEFHEAVQWPEKLLICILQPVPQLDSFLQTLEQRGAVVVNGMRELIAQLDKEICDVNDANAWRWWRRQRIGHSGVPSHVVPTHWHTIPRFTLMGTLVLPQRALYAGPTFLAGDCSTTGQRFLPPWLFLLALCAVAANAIDLYFTFRNNICGKVDAAGCPHDANCHGIIDFVWLAILAAFNLTPFLCAWSSLFETRSDVHPVMRPLLASKSMNGGVRISIDGDPDDPVVQALNKFLTNIGHNAAQEQQQCAPPPAAAASAAVAPEQNGTRGGELSKGQLLSPSCGSLHAGISLAAGFNASVKVFVMRTIAQRDALFGSEQFPFDPRSSLFVWSHPHSDPFTKDEIGERLMRFLVLVAAWDRALLAENLFSAIGVRVVDMLHSAELKNFDETTEVVPNNGSGSSLPPASPMQSDCGTAAAAAAVGAPVGTLFQPRS